MTKLWYVVNTQVRREAIASSNLRRQGYDVFLPVISKTVRHARKVRSVLEAYFPGYLFVRVDISSQRWRPIESSIGVLRLIKAGTEPTAAPAGLVESLIERSGLDGLLRLEDDGLQPGQVVRITQGPFADSLAVVDRASGEERVRVLLTLLGQATAVSLARHDVVLAKGPPKN
jgi:transcriptional antiterminator RfaH